MMRHRFKGPWGHSGRTLLRLDLMIDRLLLRMQDILLPDSTGISLAFLLIYGPSHW